MKTLSPALAILLLIGTLSPALAADTDADADGIPDIAEPLLHTDPMNADTDGDGIGDLADSDAINAPSPIAEGGAAATYRIGELLVENNVDPVAKKDAPDHLELQVFNDGSADLTDYTLFYTFTDNDSGVTEAYVVRPAVLIPAGGEARIHVDEGTMPGHLRANPNSIYLTSMAGKHVTATLQATGQAAVEATVEKDPGGAEQAD
ncbi:hypothetical protein [Donghicola mangrovi]|uniref:LTD domain-containing protein n=1 Tax=Donghicola mangrovi TaxID=2729614 RepID=A0A850QD34_9RHOB|nr:hypothetical protein [Donghicola mangrovi]NVO23781.1 hypothetical protein [Donghicola mangrovi]